MDLTIVNSKSGWNSSWGGDHFSISICLNIRIRKKVNFTWLPRLYSVKTDWSLFQSALDSVLESNMEDLRSIHDIETFYSTFISIISKCLRKASNIRQSLLYLNLLTVTHIKRPSRLNDLRDDLNNQYANFKKKIFIKICAGWWDDECDLLIKNRLEALNRFKQHKSRDNFIVYKIEVAKTRIGLRNIKKEKFKNFCESLRKDSNPSYIWKKIKSFKNNFTRAETSNKYNKETIIKI